MNWGEGLFDFYTLVHELGHYVHSVKAMESQPYIYWEYPPFLSEVASTTAENISQAWLIQNADSREEKLYHMEKYMDNLILYIYNTTLMAEFELKLYETVEAGSGPEKGPCTQCQRLPGPISQREYSMKQIFLRAYVLQSWLCW